MNYLAMGAEALASRLKQYAGVRVTYRRAGRGWVLTAIPARVTTDQATDTGAIYREVSRDFIFTVKDFASMDPPYPLRGDEVVQQFANGESWVFIVTGEGSFVSHYEEADSYGHAWRVHTKRDKKVA